MHEDISMKYCNRYVIYKLTSPSNKIYIGQSINLRRRFYSYTSCDIKNGAKIGNAIRKYGFENFQVDVLFDIKPSNRSIIILNMMEKYFIKKYDCVFCGYNSRDGGENSLHSMDSILKMRIAKSITSDYTRMKMSMAQIGRKLSDERKIQNSNIRKIPICQFDLNGVFIQEWDCAKNASLHFGLNPSTVSKCCNGDKYRHTAGGYIWKFKNNNI